MFDSVIENAVRESRKNIKIDKGDYVGDGSKFLYIDGEKSLDGFGNPLTDEGLIYCGECHELKSYRIYSSILGRVLEPYVVCKCGQKIDARERQRIIDENKQREVDRNLAQADRLMLKSTFKKDKYPDSKGSVVAKGFCQRWNEYYLPKNIGLFMYGGVGVGKTFYASCIANEIARVYGHTVKAISMTKVVNDIFSAEDKSKYISELVSYDLLILDDFGAERKTDYALEQVFSVIDERYKIQKPLIITSNLDYGEIKNAKDVQHKRIYDRIIDMCAPVELEGESRRQKPE